MTIGLQVDTLQDLTPRYAGDKTRGGVVTHLATTFTGATAAEEHEWARV